MNAVFSLASIPLLAVETIPHDWDLDAGQMLWSSGIIAFFVLLNAFFVAVEFALVKVRDSQLQEQIDEGNRGAEFTRKITQNLDSYLSAAQLGVTLASIALGWVGEPFVAHVLQPLMFKVGITSETTISAVSLALAYAVITFLHVVLGEQTPKVLALRNSLPFAIWLARPLHLFHAVFKPGIWLLNASSNWLLKNVFRVDPVAAHERVHTGEELKLIVEESERSEEVTETEKRIVLNALELNERCVRDIMTPRKDVVSLDVDEPLDVNVKLALDSGHTRFPLVEGHLDHSVGLIHIKDVLRLTQTAGPKNLRSIKRDLLIVPELMPIDKLLRLFLEKHAHLALAVEEYGGAVGIVSLDNVIEEIVGDIHDEFDVEMPEFQRLNAEEFLVEGKLNLYELNDLTDLELESDEVTTIGGYVTHVLGHLPRQGETVTIGPYEVTATKAEASRVAQLHFKRLPEVSEADEENQPAEAHSESGRE